MESTDNKLVFPKTFSEVELKLPNKTLGHNLTEELAEVVTISSY